MQSVDGRGARPGGTSPVADSRRGSIIDAFDGCSGEVGVEGDQPSSGSKDAPPDSRSAAGASGRCCTTRLRAARPRTRHGSVAPRHRRRPLGGVRAGRVLRCTSPRTARLRLPAAPAAIASSPVPQPTSRTRVDAVAARSAAIRALPWAKNGSARSASSPVSNRPGSAAASTVDHSLAGTAPVCARTSRDRTRCLPGLGAQPSRLVALAPAGLPRSAIADPRRELQRFLGGDDRD